MRDLPPGIMNEFEKELENYFCRFTFGQFVTLILLEIVTLFFVFYLGARYGPDLMGRNQAVTQKSLLPPDDSKKVEELLSNTPTDYSYPKALGDQPSDEPGSGELDPSKLDSRAVRVKPSGMTAREADQLIKRGVTPPPIEEEPSVQAAPATSSSAPSGSEKFNIQIASYPTEAEAKQMMEKWRKRGYSAFTTTGEVPGKGTWHRVRMGRFQTRAEAETYLDKFKKRENVTALVVSSKS